MSFDVYTKLLASDVVDDGTFTFAYKAGKTADSYEAGGAILVSSGLQAHFEEDDDEFDVSYGASVITVTYKGSTTLPATTSVSLQAPLDTGETFEGDVTFEEDVTAPKYLTDTDVGTVTTAATTEVEEHGDDLFHYTKLTMTDFAMGTSGDAAAKAIGAKFYTLPAGDFIIENASIVGTVLAAVDDPAAANAEVGIGTLIASGVQATLGAVDAACENVCGPVVIAAFDDTAVVGVSVAAGAQPFLRIAASGGLARDLFLNAAATWADVTAAGAVTFTGVICLKWRKID
jgi:hypothetical protein